MNTTTQRRVDHYKDRAERNWTQGFVIGLIVGLILACAWFVPTADGSRSAPRKATTATLPYPGWPPHWRTWLRIGMCEQPKRGVSWLDVRTDRQRLRNIAWRQEYNWSFPGGLGLTRLNWTTFRPRSARNVELMSRASVAQQLWAAERLWRWAERTYPGAGFTAWECSHMIGWTTSDPRDAVR